MTPKSVSTPGRQSVQFYAQMRRGGIRWTPGRGLQNRVHSPTVAYPRIHRASGDVFDLPFVEPDAEEAYELEWRKVYARVEWLASPKGRLDRWLPQTLPRQVHNANARSHSKHPNTRNVTG